ncbi:hypothetical protein ABKA04_004742 [Annulohypoxylon sp. FPYF3050]
MADKGGVFLPMYQKEAMWINFEGVSPFMIKIYAGGVNVVSGEHNREDAQTKARRSERIREGKSIQDYVVTPRQLWLDGIAVSPGVVRQFIAMPMGEGYSVEAQLTGEEVVGGLQFEITPAIPSKISYPLTMDITVKMFNGKKFMIPCSPKEPAVNSKIVSRIITVAKKSAKILADRTLADYHVYNLCSVHVEMRLRGGGISPPKPMGIAMGGKIEQTIQKDFEDPNSWLKGHTMTIPVQILNSTAFRQVTGVDPPPCPIDASTYAERGLPFFKLWEEPSSVAGDFEAVRSVRELELNRDIEQEIEAIIRPRTIEINSRSDITVPSQDTMSISDPDGLISPAGTLREFRTLADMVRDLEIET